MNDHTTYLYEYEIRRGSTVVATGELSHDQPLTPGDPFRLGAHQGVIHDLVPPAGPGRQPRLIVRLRHT